MAGRSCETRWVVFIEREQGQRTVQDKVGDIMKKIMGCLILNEHIIRLAPSVHLGKRCKRLLLIRQPIFRIEQI